MRNCLGFISFFMLVSLMVIAALYVLSFSGMFTQPVLIDGTPVDIPNAVETLLPENPLIERTNPLEPLPVPSPTPIPTPTSTPDPVFYRTEVLLRLRHFADALNSFQVTSEKLGENAELMNDPQWRHEVQVNLDLFVAAAQAVGMVEPAPAEYQSIQEWLKRVGPEAQGLRDNYLKGIETADQNYFVAAGENMDRIIEYMTQAQIKMIEAGWAP